MDQNIRKSFTLPNFLSLRTGAPLTIVFRLQGSYHRIIEKQMLQITFIMTLRMIFCCFNPLIYNFAQFGLFSISGNHLLRYSEIELTIPNFFLDFNTAAESIQTAPKRRGAKPCDTRTVRFSTTLPVLRDYWRVHPVRSSLNYASLSPDIWQFAMLPGRLSFVRWEPTTTGCGILELIMINGFSCF